MHSFSHISYMKGLKFFITLTRVPHEHAVVPSLAFV
jgi:hypothetical protein